MKRISPNDFTITVEPAFWILFVFAVLLVPLNWVAAWSIAVVLHELGHFLGLVIFRIPLYSVRIKCSGIYIQTPPMLPTQETVVAAMGPIVGLIGVAFSQVFPHLSVCAVALFIFNLLPAGGFDGGRVLRGVLALLFPQAVARFCMGAIQTGFVAVMLIMGFRLRWSLLAVSGIIMLMLRIFATFPCKRRKQIVQ